MRDVKDEIDLGQIYWNLRLMIFITIDHYFCFLTSLHPPLKLHQKIGRIQKMRSHFQHLLWIYSIEPVGRYDRMAQVKAKRLLYVSIPARSLVTYRYWLFSRFDVLSNAPVNISELMSRRQWRRSYNYEFFRLLLFPFFLIQTTQWLKTI